MAGIHLVAYDVRETSPAQPRIAALGRELARRGHRPVLWTAHQPGAWAAGTVDSRVIANPLHSAYAAVARVLGSGAGRTGHSRDPGGGRLGDLLRRVSWNAMQLVLFPDPERLWSARVGRRLAGEVGPGDVAVTFSRPESVGLAGIAAQRRGARWWFDFADGWCHQGLRRVPGRRRRRELALERAWVRRADVVSTVDEELAAWFAEQRGRADVAVLPNLVPEEFERLAGTPPLPASDAPRLTLGYLGRIELSDPDRSLEPFARILERRATAKELRLVLRGDYTARDRGEIDRLAALGVEVDVAGPLGRRELASLAERLDGLLVVSSPGRRGSSSKLLDAFGLGLAPFVLAPTDSVAARIVRESGFGAFGPFEDLDRAASSWRDYLARLRAGGYCLDPAVCFRYTSAAHVPGVVDRLVALASSSSP